MFARHLIITGLFVAATAVWAEDNPAADGFDVVGSDQKAIAIADEVMVRLGGRQNWDDTRYITWRFFGGRLHVWDKWSGNIRFEQGDAVVLMNIHTRQGKVWQGGKETVVADSLAKWLDSGYKSWINDSYWIAMPYKLKDTGVTLKYGGQGQTQEGRAADILVLTFAGVGVTPQNKYDVYVDKESRLVTQWAFYSTVGDAEPRFITPWANWRQYGRIWLSDGRGIGRQGTPRAHSEIAVFDELPASVFADPAPVDMMELAGQGQN